VAVAKLKVHHRQDECEKDTTKSEVDGHKSLRH
jgi:hypothetical protein